MPPHPGKHPPEGGPPPPPTPPQKEPPPLPPPPSNGPRLATCAALPRAEDLSSIRLRPSRRSALRPLSPRAPTCRLAFCRILRHCFTTKGAPQGSSSRSPYYTGRRARSAHEVFDTRRLYRFVATSPPPPRRSPPDSPLRATLPRADSMPSGRYEADRGVSDIARCAPVRQSRLSRHAPFLPFSALLGRSISEPRYDAESRPGFLPIPSEPDRHAGRLETIARPSQMPTACSPPRCRQRPMAGAVPASRIHLPPDGSPSPRVAPWRAWIPAFSRAAAATAAAVSLRGVPPVARPVTSRRTPFRTRFVGDHLRAKSSSPSGALSTSRLNDMPTSSRGSPSALDFVPPVNFVGATSSTCAAARSPCSQAQGGRFRLSCRRLHTFTLSCATPTPLPARQPRPTIRGFHLIAGRGVCFGMAAGLRQSL